jgi:hypothetical protein
MEELVRIFDVDEQKCIGRVGKSKKEEKKAELEEKYFEVLEDFDGEIMCYNEPEED